ncbi:MAG: AmmeMemoRadiSam system radical SAM enzyme [Bacteroidales bacterium]|nr:AmmeMemoRadiSam system radical SAM enzyme [Bacteroidales bacterium]
MEAQYYTQLENKKVSCKLCPHNCTISDGKSGVCRVRVNKNGVLISENYGIVSSIGFDPIEKKPLYHFYPGSEILSVGSLGCNLQCDFCQNWQISQTSVKDFERKGRLYKSSEIIELALSGKNNAGIAFTYNEPIVFYEYMIEIALKAHEKGLKNVMVTNGFINREPLDNLNKYIDAYSVDLKAFINDFYIDFTKSQLEPVKETLINIAKAGKHLEITNLVIPGLNDTQDKFKEMVKWIRENTGKKTVLHISRYYPAYKLKKEPTSVDKMLQLYEIAKEYLEYVYLGNLLLPEGNSTFCSECNTLLIQRSGYLTTLVAINQQGNCSVCENHILDHIK